MPGVIWWGVILLGVGTLAPSVGLLALSGEESLAVVANMETIYSAAVWGLLIGIALVTVGAWGLSRGDR